METVQDAAQSALAAQSACNLSGVVHSMSQAASLLRKEPDCTGSDWINHHPVMVLYATQIGFLTNVAPLASDACDYERCYKECLDLMKV